MAIDFRQPTAEDVPELGRIVHDAFKDIAERHGFEKDFASVEMGRMVSGMLVAREDVFGVAAYEDGQPIGSNYLLAADEVAAVGPITVDPPKQAHGVGRELMRRVMEHAKETGFESVRLQQDSYNMASLSLYASLGFDTKTPCAFMQAPPAEAPDDSVRPLTTDDLDAVEALSREFYKVSRRNEVEGLMQAGGIFPALALDRGDSVKGYIVLGMPGHAIAETVDDAVTLARQAARHAQMPDSARIFCPLVEGELYRRFLAEGFRALKVMNLMAVGPYDPPEGVWMPSIGY